MIDLLLYIVLVPCALFICTLTLLLAVKLLAMILECIALTLGTILFAVKRYALTLTKLLKKEIPS